MVPMCSWVWCIPQITSDLCSPFPHSPSALLLLSLLIQLCLPPSCLLVQDPLQGKLSSNIQRVTPSLAPGDFLPLQAGRGDMGRWLLPLDPLGQDRGGPGVAAGGFDGAGGATRSSLPSVCGAEEPEMNLPQKCSAQPIHLRHLLKKRGALAKGISLTEQKLSS